jgi:hypothetical protein
LIIGKPVEVQNFDIEKRYELIETVRNDIIKNYNDWKEAEESNIKDIKSETLELT